MDLGLNVVVPGSGRGGATVNGAGDGSGGDGAAGGTVAIPCNQRVVCRDNFGASLPLDGRGPITLADLVNFRPEPGAIRTEPTGWAVVGIHTNVFVETGVQVQNGLLLDIPAAVRFTPVAYAFDYGDGASATTAVRGSSWSAAGAREFDETPTSHVYATSGRFTATAVTDFMAEYSFGATGEWTPIAGVVRVPTGSVQLTVATADTVLVARDCQADSGGLGC